MYNYYCSNKETSDKMLLCNCDYYISIIISAYFSMLLQEMIYTEFFTQGDLEMVGCDGFSVHGFNEILFFTEFKPTEY